MGDYLRGTDLAHIPDGGNDDYREIAWRQTMQRRHPLLAELIYDKFLVLFLEPWWSIMTIEVKLMKVVLFCGGAGMRLRGYSEDVPKPMVTVGTRPILWHVMKYYAHYGHKEFVICLGYKGNVIKNYFLEYEESVSNDFVFSQGGQHSISCSGISTIGRSLLSIPDRLHHRRPLASGRTVPGSDEVFLANYSDGLTDFFLPQMIEDFSRRDSYASFLSVQPRSSSMDTVQLCEDGLVRAIKCMKESNIWVNGRLFRAAQRCVPLFEAWGRVCL